MVLFSGLKMKRDNSNDCVSCAEIKQSITEHFVNQENINSQLLEGNKEIKANLQKLHSVIYEGNGTPSMKSEIERIDSHHKNFESSIENINVRLNKFDDKATDVLMNSKMNSKTLALIVGITVLLGGAIMSGIAAYIVQSLKGGG